MSTQPASSPTARPSIRRRHAHSIKARFAAARLDIRVAQAAWADFRRRIPEAGVRDDLDLIQGACSAEVEFFLGTFSRETLAALRER